MKIGKLSNTNSKGQLVLPQEYRVLFGITENVTLNIIPQANGIFIQPVESVVPVAPTNSVYADVLDKTTGSWNMTTADKVKETEKRKLELKASKRRKGEW